MSKFWRLALGTLWVKFISDTVKDRGNPLTHYQKPSAQSIQRFDLLCLMSLSGIFQLYNGDQF
jgi:hypothetical protein